MEKTLAKEAKLSFMGDVPLALHQRTVLLCVLCRGPFTKISLCGHLRHFCFDSLLGADVATSSNRLD